MRQPLLSLLALAAALATGGIASASNCPEGTSCCAGFTENASSTPGKRGIEPVCDAVTLEDAAGNSAPTCPYSTDVLASHSPAPGPVCLETMKIPTLSKELVLQCSASSAETGTIRMDIRACSAKYPGEAYCFYIDFVEPTGQTFEAFSARISTTQIPTSDNPGSHPYKAEGTGSTKKEQFCFFDGTYCEVPISEVVTGLGCSQDLYVATHATIKPAGDSCWAGPIGSWPRLQFKTKITCKDVCKDFCCCAPPPPPPECDDANHSDECKQQKCSAEEEADGCQTKCSKDVFGHDYDCKCCCKIPDAPTCNPNGDFPDTCSDSNKCDALAHGEDDGRCSKTCTYDCAGNEVECSCCCKPPPPPTCDAQGQGEFTDSCSSIDRCSSIGSDETTAGGLCTKRCTYDCEGNEIECKCCCKEPEAPTCEAVGGGDYTETCSTTDKCASLGNGDTTVDGKCTKTCATDCDGNVLEDTCKCCCKPANPECPQDGSSNCSQDSRCDSLSDGQQSSDGKCTKKCDSGCSDECLCCCQPPDQVCSSGEVCGASDCPAACTEVVTGQTCDGENVKSCCCDEPAEPSCPAGTNKCEPATTRKMLLRSLFGGQTWPSKRDPTITCPGGVDPTCATSLCGDGPSDTCVCCCPGKTCSDTAYPNPGSYGGNLWDLPKTDSKKCTNAWGSYLLAKPGTDFTVELVSGAGQNVWSKGTIVGDVKISWSGNCVTAAVSADTAGGHGVGLVHMHFTCKDPGSKDDLGKFCRSPGQYNSPSGCLSDHSGYSKTYCSSCGTAGTYIIVHAEALYAAGADDSCSEYSCS